MQINASKHLNTAQKNKFSIKNFFNKYDPIRRKLHITEEILNGELNFLCSAKHASTQLRQV